MAAEAVAAAEQLSLVTFASEIAEKRLSIASQDRVANLEFTCSGIGGGGGRSLIAFICCVICRFKLFKLLI